MGQESMKERERNGRCGICGNQIYKLRYFGYQRESLTISNVVCNGRCLLCYPIEELSIVESNGYNNDNTITTNGELLSDDDSIDDSNIPIALAIPFEMIEHCDAVLIDTEVISTTSISFPEPSAPPKEDENFVDDDDHENESESISKNLNEMENSNDDDNLTLSWFIIREEDIKINLNENGFNISRKSNLKPKVVLVSKIVYDKLSSMIDYGTINATNTLANISTICTYHHSSEISSDTNSTVEIELKEFISPS